MKPLNAKYYKNPSSDNWSGRDSETNEYYVHEKVIIRSLKDLQKSGKKDIAIMGYATDEGVRRNQGRVGASDGPQAIRNRFGKYSNHFDCTINIYDVGDIITPDGDMEAGQENLTHAIQRLLSLGYYPIVLGGGHDIALGHYRGIKSSINENDRLGIINFDAHLDLRALKESGNSGTPFYQISNEVPIEDFHYMAIGIQEIANHKGLFEIAKDKNVKIITLDQCEKEWEPIKLEIENFLSDLTHIYITMDLDGFSSAYSPGVSAPSPLGLTPSFVQKALELIFNSGKVTSIDLAEMNPNYDLSDATAKLASSIVYQCIKSI